MEHPGFEAGFEIVNLLEAEPRIGLEGGWKPTPRRAESGVNEEGNEGIDEGTDEGVDEEEDGGMGEGKEGKEGKEGHESKEAASASASASESLWMGRSLGPREDRLGGDIELDGVLFKYDGMQVSESVRDGWIDLTHIGILEYVIPSISHSYNALICKCFKIKC